MKTLPNNMKTLPNNMKTLPNNMKTLPKCLIVVVFFLFASVSQVLFASSSFIAKSNFNPLIQKGSQAETQQESDNQQMANANEFSLTADSLYADDNGFNPPDPLESFNRPVFKFNLLLDDYLLSPIAKGYKKLTPNLVDDSVTNFFNNASNITSTVNFLFQGEFKKSGQTLVRFVGNTVFGFLGLFDVATKFNIPEYYTDFNHTLKKWHVGNGPYIVLPFFGPNTPRTFVGGYIDGYTDPIEYLDVRERNFLMILGLIDYRADNQSLFDMAKNASFDPYDSMRLFFLRKEMQKEGDIDFEQYDY